MTVDQSFSPSTSSDEDGEKRRPPALWSACALLFSAIVACIVYMHLKSGLLFCTSDRSRGANVEHGLGIAFYGSIAAALAIPFVRKHRRPHGCFAPRRGGAWRRDGLRRSRRCELGRDEQLRFHGDDGHLMAATFCRPDSAPFANDPGEGRARYDLFGVRSGCAARC
jgi:hypothetical protein